MGRSARDLDVDIGPPDVDIARIGRRRILQCHLEDHRPARLRRFGRKAGVNSFRGAFDRLVVVRGNRRSYVISFANPSDDELHAHNDHDDEHRDERGESEMTIDPRSARAFSSGTRARAGSRTRPARRLLTRCRLALCACLSWLRRTFSSVGGRPLPAVRALPAA